MNKKEILEAILQTGVVAVIRAASKEQALKMVQSCVDGGVKAVEITFTVPGALEIIRKLAAHYKSTDVIIGAGTVMDKKTAQNAVEAGAKYVVSPCLVEEVAAYCVEAGVACMPGAMTVREAVMCHKAGADIIKIFPGELFGPAIIKAFKAPLPYLKMMPTGGVNPQNAAEWIKAGAVAVGVGGQLTAGAKTGDYDSIRVKAKELVDAVAKARIN